MHHKSVCTDGSCSTTLQRQRKTLNPEQRYCFNSKFQTNICPVLLHTIKNHKLKRKFPNQPNQQVRWFLSLYHIYKKNSINEFFTYFLFIFKILFQYLLLFSYFFSYTRVSIFASLRFFSVRVPIIDQPLLIFVQVFFLL